MKYLVIVHYIRKGSHEMRTTQRGFSTLDLAEAYAEDWYNAEELEEVQALIYELKKSYN